MSNCCKTIRSKYPYSTVLQRLKRTVGIFVSYCFTAIGHYILLHLACFSTFYRGTMLSLL